MRLLRTNTAVIVTVGPFFDKTDGVTLETALTITNERISFTVDSDAGSAPTLVLDNVTGATSGTSNDLNYITNCDAALMQLELSAADTNYLGRAFLTVTDAANHVPVFHEFTILPQLVYDSLVAGTDALQVDTIQVGGTAQTARDLGASVLLSSGTGTGQVSLTSGLVTLAGVTHTGAVIPTVTTTTTATNLTNLPSIPANWLTAAGIAASALNGKGDWNVGKTGYALTATTGLGNQTANITGNLSGSVGSVTGAVGSVTAAVTAGTVSDKTGYSLTATTGLGNQTANITGNLSGSVGSVTGAVGSVTGAVGSVTGAVGSVTGAVGSIGAGGIASTSFATGAITATAIAADAIGASELATDAVTEIVNAVWANATRTLSANTNFNDPTAAAIADAVWDEARSGHTSAGSFGQYCLSDVRYVNGVQVTGDGDTTPWGPV